MYELYAIYGIQISTIHFGYEVLIMQAIYDGRVCIEFVIECNNDNKRKQENAETELQESPTNCDFVLR